MALKIVKYESRSPNWYVVGTIKGVNVFESTRTADKSLAEAYLTERLTTLYRTAVLKNGSIPSIPEAMLKELSALAERARNRTQKRREKNLITNDHIKALFVKQRGKCAVSGIDFTLDALNEDDKRSRAFAPSIDRINNHVGYTSDNIRLVCRIANYAMNTWGDEALLKLSLSVVAMWEKCVQA